MRYSRSPDGVEQGTSIKVKDDFSKTLNTPEKHMSSSTGFALTSNNLFVTQKG